MNWSVSTVAEHYLFPPMPALFLLILAAALWRWPILSRRLFFVGTAVFLLMSMPILGKLYLWGLIFSVPRYDTVTSIDAVVVPTAGVYADGAGNMWPSEATVKRVMVAMALHERNLERPLILSGGCPLDEDHCNYSEAKIALRALNLESTPGIILDEFSKNSLETAANVSAFLRSSGVHQIAVVTTDLHMLRMKLSFNKQGIQVVSVPIPTGDINALSIIDIIPSRKGAGLFVLGTKEYLGILWYWLADRI